MKNLIISIVSCCILLASCKKAPVQMERVSLEDVPEFYLPIDTKQRIGSLTSPEINLLNDTIIFFPSYMDLNDLIFIFTESNSTQVHHIRSKNQKVRISNDRKLNCRAGFYNHYKRMYFDYEVIGGELGIKEHKRLWLSNDTFNKVVKPDDRYFVGLGNYTKGLFGMLDSKTNEIKHFGGFPIKESRYTSKDHLEYFTGYITSKNDKIVYVSELFGYIACYKFKNGKPTRLWEKQLTDYSYTGRINRIDFNDDHFWGFEGVAMSDNYIYGLYLGFSNETEPAENELFNSVLIFDQKGNPVAKCIFPDFMESIVVDSKDNYLYATYTPVIGETYLVSFKLPNLK